MVGAGAGGPLGPLDGGRLEGAREAAGAPDGARVVGVGVVGGSGGAGHRGGGGRREAGGPSWLELARAARVGPPAEAEHRARGAACRGGALALALSLARGFGAGGLGSAAAAAPRLASATAPGGPPRCVQKRRLS